MAIQFACDACGTTLLVKDEFGGLVIKCRNCSSSLRVPRVFEFEPLPSRRRGSLLSLGNFFKLGLVGLLLSVAFAFVASVNSARDAAHVARQRNPLPAVAPLDGPVPPASSPPPSPPPPSPLTKPTVKPANSFLSAGDYGVLELPGGSIVLLACKDSDWDEMLDAENAIAAKKPGAEDLVLRLLRADRIFSAHNGRRVVVLQTSFTAYLVSLKDGIGVGRSGWVQKEFVRPLNQSDIDALDRRDARKIELDAKTQAENAELEAFDRERAAQRANDNQEAALAKTRKLQEARATSLLSAGKSLEDLGKTKAAIETYRKIIDELGDTPSAKAASERIKFLSGK